MRFDTVQVLDYTLMGQSLKRYTEAAAEWQRAADFAEGQARWDYRTQPRVALARGGDSARASAETDAITAEPGCPSDPRYNSACILVLSGRAEMAVALLGNLRNDGYFDNANWLKKLSTDTGLDSLRHRDDFIKLVTSAQK